MEWRPQHHHVFDNYPLNNPADVMLFCVFLRQRHKKLRGFKTDNIIVTSELPYFYHFPPWLAHCSTDRIYRHHCVNLWCCLIETTGTLLTRQQHVHHVFNVLTRKTRKMWLSWARHLSITQSKLYIMSVCWTNFCNFRYQLLDEHFQSFVTEKLEISELTPAFMFELPLYQNRIWRNCISKNVLKI